MKRVWEDHPGPTVAVVALVVMLVVGGIAVLLRDTGDTLDPDLASVTLESCSDDGATGTVENLSDRTATPVVEVGFLDDAGDLIQKGSVTRPGMDPGEIASWEIPFRLDLVEGEATVDSCDVNIPTLFKFNT